MSSHSRWSATRCAAFAAALAIAGVGASPAAHGQTKPNAASSAAASQSAAKAPDGDEASVLFRKAIAAHDGGLLPEAEVLFLKVWSLKKTWDVAANLGLVESRLGKHAAAAQHLAFAARMVPPTEASSTTTELLKRLAEVRKDVFAMNVRANIDGAEVLVNGEAKGTTPLSDPIFTTPGTVTLEIKKSGHETAVQKIEGTKGGTQEISLNLAPSPPAAAGARKEIVIAGASLSGAALIAGAVLAGLSASKASEAEGLGGWDRCYDGSPPSPTCPALHALRADSAAFGNGAAWLFIGGTVVGGATLAYGLLASKSVTSGKAGVQVVPVVAEGSAGLLLHGRF